LIVEIWYNEYISFASKYAVEAIGAGEHAGISVNQAGDARQDWSRE